MVNGMDTTKLKQTALLMNESALTPEKGLEYRTAIAALEKRASDYEAKASNLTTEIAELTEENTLLKEQLAMYKKALYGQKSEKSTVINDGVQLSFFNEAETEADVDVKNAEKQITVPEHTRKAKRTHAEILASLPIEEVVTPLENKNCPECGTKLVAAGKDFVRDELVYVKARMYVRKIYVEVMKCPVCGNDEAKDAVLPDIEKAVIVKAAAPAPFISHSFATPELLAHIIFEKYCQAVPLYRQEKEFRALGVELSRTTMANWVIYAATKWVIPVCNAMKAELLKSNVIHADETVVQVLHEEGRKATTDSRMWVYASPKSSDHYIAIFQYAPTRSGSNAVNFLGDFKGYLVCDGYDGYNKLKSAIRCGCFAHVRRKFVDALPDDKKLLATSKAAEGVKWCNRLYNLEREYNGLNDREESVNTPLTQEEKHKQRQEQSKPVLDDFYLWLSKVNPVGGSNLAKAVQYAKNEKVYLYRFLDNPEIPLDNNRAENAIRPFTVGRKNWLFSDSVAGAEASAALYSLAATAIANGLNAEEYFTRLLQSDHPLMPW